jgi:hypothetical protein
VRLSNPDAPGLVDNKKSWKFGYVIGLFKGFVAVNDICPLLGAPLEKLVLPQNLWAVIE